MSDAAFTEMKASVTVLEGKLDKESKSRKRQMVEMKKEQNAKWAEVTKESNEKQVMMDKMIETILESQQQLKNKLENIEQTPQAVKKSSDEVLNEQELGMLERVEKRKFKPS